MKIFVCLLAAAGTALAQEPRSAGWIVIPVTEYTTLRAKAFPPDREPDHPSIEASLSRVDYDLRVDGDLASGRATLSIDVLQDGWVRVPVPAGLAAREARIEGKLVSLVPFGNTLAVLLFQRGRSVVQLEIALPVASGGGEERLTLPAGASGVTRASLSMPRPDLEMKVSGGLLADRADGEGESRWTAFARGNEALSFTWRRKMEEQRRAPQSLRLRGSLAQLVSLGEDGNTVSAEVSLEIVQGAARVVRVSVPASVTVNTVAGASVADWEIKDGALAVTFLEPVEQKAAFVITGETRLPHDGSIDLPLLRLLDVERESGGIAVEVLGAGEIRNLRSQGLERTEAAGLGAAIAARQSPSVVAFRYRTTTVDRALNIDVVRYTQQAVLTANVEEAHYRVLIAPDGKTLVEARYAVRNNQRNFVRITLPAGSSLWSASLAGRPARPGRAPDGSLLFPLSKSRAGENAPVFTVEILYLTPSAAWSDKGRVTLTLPALDLPVSRTGVALYYPPRHRVAPEPGAFRVQASDAVAVPVLLRDENANAVPSVPVANSASQALVDRYRTLRDVRRPVESAPLRISFPALGPELYLASELTAENQAAVIDLIYQKEHKGGRP